MQVFKVFYFQQADCVWNMSFMFCAAHFSTCGHVSCNHYMYMSDSTCWCATWTAVSSEQVTDLIFQSNCLTCPLSHLVFPQSKDFLITQSKHGRDEEKNKRKKEKKELQWPTHWTHWSAQVCIQCGFPSGRHLSGELSGKSFLLMTK